MSETNGFSPEDIIKKLKMQLNINSDASENEDVDEEKKEQTENSGEPVTEDFRDDVPAEDENAEVITDDLQNTADTPVTVSPEQTDETISDETEGNQDILDQVNNDIDDAITETSDNIIDIGNAAGETVSNTVEADDLLKYLEKHNDTVNKGETSFSDAFPGLFDRIEENTVADDTVSNDEAVSATTDTVVPDNDNTVVAESVTDTTDSPVITSDDEPDVIVNDDTLPGTDNDTDDVRIFSKDSTRKIPNAPLDDDIITTSPENYDYSDSQKETPEVVSDKVPDDQLVSDSNNGVRIPMLLALGVPVEEVERMYGKEAAERYAAEMEKGAGVVPGDEDIYEYTSESQKPEIKNRLGYGKRVGILRTIVLAVLFVLSFIFENSAALGIDGGFMNQANYPLVHTMIDLQLLILAAALSFEFISDGFKRLFTKEHNVNSLITIAVVVDVILLIVMAFYHPENVIYKYSSSALVFALLVRAVMDLLESLNLLKSFESVSTGKDKITAVTGTNTDSENVVSFKKTGFVNGFFGKMTRTTTSVFELIVAPAVAFAFVILIICLVFKKVSVASSLNTVFSSVMLLVPVTVFASGFMSFLRSARFALSQKSLILGKDSIKNFSNVSSVTFDDTDAFPAHCIKIKNIKLYGRYAIDYVLSVAASAFAEVGGPLAEVFRMATNEIDGILPFTLTESMSHGFTGKYGDSAVLIGNREFLSRNGITPYADADDDSLLKEDNTRAMFIVVDGMLVAKLYVRYTVYNEFESIVSDLDDFGVSSRIATRDPNIDISLLKNSFAKTKNPVGVIFKGVSDHDVEVTSDSELIGNGTALDLAGTVMLCDRTSKVIRTNDVLKPIAVLIGLIISLCVVFTGGTPFGAAFLVLYQILWLIPTLLLSRLFV